MQTENELEQLLRKAPAPAAPLGLEERLVRQASRPRREEPPAWSWFSRFKNWAPALALVMVMAGLLAVLAVQQNTLSNLEKRQKELAAQLPLKGTAFEGQEEKSLERQFRQLQKDAAELQALHAEMGEIERLLAQQPQLAAENKALRAELSSLTKNNPEASPEFQAALAEARKKADRIKCVNNLKNVGLAARIWAVENVEHLPGDFLTAKNELNSPRILMCPSDPARPQGIDNWEQFPAVGSSYELLAPGISQEVLSAVYARCPFHNTVVLCDGSVHQLKPGQQLVQRNGHWEINE